MAKQLIVDLYGCDSVILDSEEKVRNISKQIIERVGATIVEECFKKFEPIGITYFAIISTSHFSVHTWPENGYAAVDLFSCSEFDEEYICELLKTFFKASEVKSSLVVRRLTAYE